MGGFELDMLVLQDLLRDTIWERGKFPEDTGREMASSTIGTAKAMRVALLLEEGQTEMRSSM